MLNSPRPDKLVKVPAIDADQKLILEAQSVRIVQLTETNDALNGVIEKLNDAYDDLEKQHRKKKFWIWLKGVGSGIVTGAILVMLSGGTAGPQNSVIGGSLAAAGDILVVVGAFQDVAFAEETQNHRVVPGGLEQELGLRRWEETILPYRCTYPTTMPPIAPILL